MMNEGISVADALALRGTGNGYGSNGDNGFGGNNAWWIIIIILLFAFGRYGNNGNNGNSNGGANGYNVCCVPATAQGITDAFNFNQLDNGIRVIEQGLCNGFYTAAQDSSALATAIQNCCCNVERAVSDSAYGTQSAIANLGFQTQQGFCGVDKSIMTTNFNNQAGFNAIGSQLASCCCDIERGQDKINCAVSDATSRLLVANDKNTDRIINYLTQTEMDKLRTELQSAQFQLSQLSQTSNLINTLMPVAKPAYITCSPYASALGLNGYNGFGYGCGSNCGCTCA